VKYAEKHGEILENFCASIDARTSQLGYFASPKNAASPGKNILKVCGVGNTVIS
jgi:hypothetical protein